MPGISPAPVVVLLMGAAALTACGNDTGQEDLLGRWVPVSSPSSELGPRFNLSSAPITFRADGTWIASDGCNDLNGTYSAERGRFEYPPGGGFALVGCVFGQISYDSILLRAETVERSGNQLEFTDSDGDLLLRLKPADPR